VSILNGKFFDGSFYPMIHKAKDYKNGYQIQATFDIAQIDSETKL
jgi:hypothetical protein